MKGILIAVSLVALGVGQATGETILEQAARLLRTPSVEGKAGGINVHYTIVIPEPRPGYPVWPYGRAYAYPYPAYPPPYPPPGSYWHAQVPLTPGLGAGPRAYPSAVYIYPSFVSGWAYGPTYIPSPGQAAPWQARPRSVQREERSEEAPEATERGPERGGPEPGQPVVIQAAETSDEEVSFLPLKRVALETSPRHPGLEIEAIGNGRVKVTLSEAGESEIESVEMGLVSQEGKTLDSASFSKPAYSATLWGEWRQARLRLVLRFKGGGTAEFMLPLKEKPEGVEAREPAPQEAGSR